MVCLFVSGFARTFPALQEHICDVLVGQLVAPDR